MAWSPAGEEDLSKLKSVPWFADNVQRMIEFHSAQLNYWQSLKQSLAAAPEAKAALTAVPEKAPQVGVSGSSSASPGSKLPPMPKMGGLPPMPGSAAAKATTDKSTAAATSGARPTSTSSPKPPKPNKPQPPKPGGPPPFKAKAPKPTGPPPVPAHAAGGAGGQVHGGGKLPRMPSEVVAAPASSQPVKPPKPNALPAMPKQAGGSAAGDRESVAAPSVHRGMPPLPGMAAGGKPTKVPITPQNQKMTAAAAEAGTWPKATLKFDFESTDATCVSVKKGVVVDVLRKDDSGWVKVCTPDKRKGYVPADFLEDVPTEDAPKPAPRQKMFGAVRGAPQGLMAQMAAAAAARAGGKGKAGTGVKAGGGAASTSSANQAAAAAAAPVPEPKAAASSGASGTPSGPKKKKIFCKAAFEYKSDDKDDLVFDKGTIIRVLTTDSDGWMTGELQKKRGPFPTNRVEMLSDDIKVALARWDFQGSDDTQLTVDPNEYVIIHDSSNEAWWSAESKGKKGFVPANYLELLN